MEILERIFRGNTDRLIKSLTLINRRKRELRDKYIGALNKGRSIKPQIDKLIRAEIDVLRKIVKMPEIHKAIFSAILTNLKKGGVLSDTSNFRFIERYRSEKALDEARKLLEKEIKQMPILLKEFSASPADITAKSSYHIRKIQLYLQKIINLDKKELQSKMDIKSLVKAKHDERAVLNLLNFYTVSSIRKCIVRIKTYLAFNKIRPRKSIFFIFGGMENRYIPLVSELIKKLKTKSRKINDYIYVASLKDIDVYFMICIGASSRYFPPYYYMPTARDLVKFMRKRFGAQNIKSVYFMGVCGSFKHNTGTVYLPDQFSKLFYSFENKVHEVQKIKKDYIKIDNKLKGFIRGRPSRVFTCSTLFNRSIVAVGKDTYGSISSQVEKDKTVPNNQKREEKLRQVTLWKEMQLKRFLKTIVRQNIADGVEMESYIFAKYFGNKLGVYMEVSDNLMKGDKVSFDMRSFHRNVNDHFIRIMEKII